jgi:hypothetical protein
MCVSVCLCVRMYVEVIILTTLMMPVIWSNREAYNTSDLVKSRGLQYERSGQIERLTIRAIWSNREAYNKRDLLKSKE